MANTCLGLFGGATLTAEIIYIVAYRPVARQGLRNNDTTAVTMQRRGKHASITIELLLKTVFSTPSVQRGYKEGNWGHPIS
jgi:hypothetical protein